MTELKSFLAGIYDALSEAEMAAIAHGQTRRVELRERGVLPRNMAVPVYHASNVEVTLDVGLAAEETSEGTRVFIEDPSGDNSSITFSVELFELIEEQDLGDIDYGEILDVPTGVDLPPTDLPQDLGDQPTAEPGAEEGGDGDQEEQDTGAEPGSEGVSDGGSETAAPETGMLPDELAEELTSSSNRPVSSDEVERVDGIGPTYGERLRVEGIETMADLSGRSPAEIADIVSTDSHSVSAERTASWVSTVEALDEQADDSEDETTENGESSEEGADGDGADEASGGPDDGDDGNGSDSRDDNGDDGDDASREMGDSFTGIDDTGGTDTRSDQS